MAFSPENLFELAIFVTTIKKSENKFGLSKYEKDTAGLKYESILKPVVSSTSPLLSSLRAVCLPSLRSGFLTWRFEWPVSLHYNRWFEDARSSLMLKFVWFILVDSQMT